MAASLGVLTLDLVARIGGYTAGLDKAEREAQKRAKAIEGAFDKAAMGVGVAFGLMATAAVAAFAAINKGIEEAAKFQDLAEMTGGSAEGLASIAVAAATAGVSMESVAEASNKLTKNLVGVDDESKATGAALKALNVELEDFKKLSPEQRVDTLTKAFASFADGSGKSAVAMALWGRAGAEQLKLMKALEEQGGRTTILTKEQIEEADKLADAQAKLRAELGLYASAIATQFVGPMNEVIKITIDVVKELGGFNKSIADVASNSGVRDFAQSSAVALVTFIEAISNAVAAIGALMRGAQLLGTNLRLAAEGASFVVSGGMVGTEGIKNAYKNNIDAYEKLSGSFKGVIDRAKTSEGKKLRELFDQQNLMAAYKPRRPLPTKPELVFDGVVKPPKPPRTPKAGGGGGGAKDDDTKNLLANELKSLEDTIAKERDLMASRNKFLDLYNSQGLISVKDYYAQRQTILDDAVASQSAAYDAEIAALQNYLAKAPKATDRASTQGKINEVLEKQAKLHRDAGLAGIEAGIKQTQAQKQVQAAVEEVNAKILEFTGNLSAAAAIRFDAQNETLKNTFTAEGNQLALQNLATLRAYTLAQADLTKIQQQFSLAQGDLQIAEERITIARERGTMGEIESLRASGAARQQAVALMEKHLAVLLSINDAARSPEQVQAIERLKVQLEGLKATVDPLADKFNTMFSDAAGSAFTDFINGTKTAKEAFKSFTDSIFKQLTDLIVKDLFKQLFSSSGGGTGFNLGKMLSDFFGSASGGSMFGAAKGAAEPAAKAAGGEDVLGAFISKLGPADAAATSAAASSTALATSATAASAALSAMATAAAATTAAMSASGATSGLGAFGGAISDTAKSAAEKSANERGGDDILGSFISELGASGSSLAASNAALTASVTAATAAITALAAAASAAATAMAAAAATSSSSALGSLASSLSSANAIGASGGDSLGALILSRGWQSGGFTGTGAANDVAGFVHKREYVFDEKTTQRLGVANLNRIKGGGSLGYSQVNNFVVPGNIDHRTVFANQVDSGFNIRKILAALFGAASGGGDVAAAAKVAAETSAKSASGENVLGEFIRKIWLVDDATGATSTAFDARLAAATTTIGALVAAAATISSSALARSSPSSANAIGSSGAHVLDELLKLRGWQSGGFTGMGAANEPAGFVHKREFVLNPAATERLGVANLNRMNRGGSAGFSQVNNFAVQGQIDHQTDFATSVDSGLNIGKMLSGLFGWASGGVVAAAKVASEAASAKSASGWGDLGAFNWKRVLGEPDTTSAAASSPAFSASAAAASAITALAATVSSAAKAIAAAADTSGSSAFGSLASSMSSANAIGATSGLALDELLKLRGWSGGGFTGMGSANDVAGFVHKREYVLDANTTQRLGVSYLDGIKNGGSPGGTNVVINQQFAAGTSRETTNQAALAASRVISRSQRNA